ncbi:hypothetical protein DPMN_174993 [Dreissena polymorpha]|uniref:Uncharacterized protein n=1 Tax=Dreissena polymorpha TaxID=45954 RepID=A0A9D4IGV8_DREPO|nr:hypothetical protein DPMN_174993 [Dreissena polymorpha]
MYDQSDKLAHSFTSPTTDLTRQCLSDVPKSRTLETEYFHAVFTKQEKRIYGDF